MISVLDKQSANQQNYEYIYNQDTVKKTIETILNIAIWKDW